jgi:hypothetical protein
VLIVDDDSLRRALAPAAVLYKPFNKKDLIEAIGRACRRDDAATFRLMV